MIKILTVSIVILSVIFSCSIKKNHDLVYEYEDDKLFIQLELTKYKANNSFLYGDLLVTNKTDEIQKFSNKDLFLKYKEQESRAYHDSILSMMIDFGYIDIKANMAMKEEIYFLIKQAEFSLDSINTHNSFIGYFNVAHDNLLLSRDDFLVSQNKADSVSFNQQNPFTKYCSNIVKSITSYQTAETMKVWNGSGDPADFEVGFDLSHYFEILTNLKTLSGNKLDYVYHHDHPRIYGYSTSESAKKILQIRDKLYNSHDDNDELEYLSFVTAEDNELGYFEFILLYIKANQFYIWDHGIYLRDEIVTSYEMLMEQESKHTGIISYKFSDPEIKILRDENFAPKVILKPDYAEVTVLLFSIWKGVRRNKYQVSRTIPHNIKLIDSEIIVDRVCGVII